MSFLDDIDAALQRNADASVLREMHPSGPIDITGRDLRARITQMRNRLTALDVTPGDRCVLIAANSADWVAADLAIMASGAIAVPMYNRQAADELATMIQDCQPRCVLVDDDELRAALDPLLAGDLRSTPLRVAPEPADPAPPAARQPDDPVTIIYTSGTSGSAKGVVLTAGNLDHMLTNTAGRLDALLADVPAPERFFHYLPFCFCGSWILLLSSLRRGSVLAMSMNLERLREELAAAQPHFFMNVPTLLERVRRGVEERLATRGFARWLMHRANRAWRRRRDGQAGWRDGGWLRLADWLIGRPIRRQLSPCLRGVACGSAPLAEDTQVFFEQLRIPVLLVYGLTETTAICTMDRPGHTVPGRVGTAVNQVEMRLGDNDEILVRGPNIFPGYWQRPDETAAVFDGEWFRTGDQGEVDANGNWRIVGRIKNLIILNSGHNIAPEPIEEALHAALPAAGQVVLVGNARSYLVALVTGTVEPAEVRAALDRINIQLPHYKRIRGYLDCGPPFTANDGLLTANGKLRRTAIADRFATEIDRMYQRRAS